MKRVIIISLAALAAVALGQSPLAEGMDGVWSRMVGAHLEALREDASVFLGMRQTRGEGTGMEPYSFFPSRPVETVPDVAGDFSNIFSPRLDFLKTVSRIELVSFNYSSERLAETLSLLNKPLDEQYRLLVKRLRMGDTRTSGEETVDEPEGD